jgi:hypothetical protein
MKKESKEWYKSIYKKYSDLPNDVIREIINHKKNEIKKSNNYIFIKNRIEYLNKEIKITEHLLNGEIYIKDLRNGYSSICHPYDINNTIKYLEELKRQRKEISNEIRHLKFERSIN